MRDARALLDPKLDVAEHPLHLPLFDHRADLRAGVEGMAERDLRCLRFGDLRDQRLPDRAVRENPRARMAGLALIVIDAPGDRLRRRVEIGVGHHHMGRLAAAFERDPFHIALAGVDHHQLAHLGRAGEGDHVDVGVQRERLPRLLAKARHNVEYAVGEPRLFGKSAENQRGERRLLGRFRITELPATSAGPSSRRR